MGIYFIEDLFFICPLILGQKRRSTHYEEARKGGVDHNRLPNVLKLFVGHSKYETDKKI